MARPRLLSSAETLSLLEEPGMVQNEGLVQVLATELTFPAKERRTYHLNDGQVLLVRIRRFCEVVANGGSFTVIEGVTDTVIDATLYSSQEEFLHLLLVSEPIESDYFGEEWDEYFEDKYSRSWGSAAENEQEWKQILLCKESVS
jgi:hypothetical protein